MAPVRPRRRGLPFGCVGEELDPGDGRKQPVVQLVEPLAVGLEPLVQGLAAVPVLSGLPARSMKTRTAVSPGSTAGSSPYPSTSTRAKVSSGKADSSRFFTALDIASSTGSS
jgi:hypothetical protein